MHATATECVISSDCGFDSKQLCLVSVWSFISGVSYNYWNYKYECGLATQFAVLVGFMEHIIKSSIINIMNASPVPLLDFPTYVRMHNNILSQGSVMQALYQTAVVKRDLSQKAKLSIHQSINVPALTYGHEL